MKSNYRCGCTSSPISISQHTILASDISLEEEDYHRQQSMGNVCQFERSLKCSPVPLHYKINLQAAYPDRVYMDDSKCIVVSNDVNPTEELGYTMMNSGMSA